MSFPGLSWALVIPVVFWTRFGGQQEPPGCSILSASRGVAEGEG
jgi:hypothetical protein